MTDLSPTATTSLVVALMAVAQAKPESRPARPALARRRPRPVRRIRT